MAKSKGKKEDGTIPQKHLHSRISYLYQAAEYMNVAAERDNTSLQVVGEKLEPLRAELKPEFKQSLFLLSQLRSVSRKSQLRLSQGLNRSLCRRCNTRLIPGRTSCEEIENLSVDGQKPWADVLCVSCLICGMKKRFPIGARRQSESRPMSEAGLPPS